MAERYFTIDEYESRWSRVHAEMKNRGVPAAVVWGRSNQTYDRSGDVLYLANYYCPEVPADSLEKNAWGYYAVILQPGAVPELVADSADDRNSHLPVKNVSRFSNIITGLAQRLTQRGISGPVAIVGTDILAWKYAKELELATEGVAWIPMDDLVRTVRKIKSDQEMNLMREGGMVAGASLDILMKELVMGKSERDAVAEAVRVLYRQGGQGSFISTNHGNTISYWCREPLIGRSADAPKPGDFVRGWMDCLYKGYWFDPGRTAVAGGNPNSQQQKLIDDCVKIIEGVSAAIKPGAHLKDILAIGDSLVASVGGNGSAAMIPKATYAHGIGLHWEAPSVNRNSLDGDAIIQENMAMGVEYFLSREGVGTVGIEENILVLADHNESLLKLPIQGW